MTEIRFVGHVHAAGQVWPVDITIPLPGPSDAAPGQLGQNDGSLVAAPGPNDGPIEIRQHDGRQITRQAVAAADSDKERWALLAARFPWLADVISVQPAAQDPVAADVQRLADVPIDKLLKPDGSINKSAVARELDYSTGGSAWDHITEVVEQLQTLKKAA